MKKIFVLSLLFVFIFSALSYSKEVVVDRIVATVEGQPITAYELENVAGFYGAKNVKVLLNRVVDDYIIMYYAKKMGITVNDDDVDKFISNMAQRNNLSPDMFLQKIKASGIDLDYYKQGIKLILYRRQFAMKMFAPTVRIAEADIERYYKLHKSEFKANPVLTMNIIAVRNRKLAEEIYGKLQSGADFNTLKNKFSIDKSAVKKIPLSAFNKDIQSELSKLKAGDISNIIEANKTFYIVKLINRQGGQVNLNNANGEIRNILFGRKIQAKLISWLKMVKSRTDIEIFE